MFLIPYNKLSNAQKSIIKRVSRDDSNLFVEGPPGSGKTLISLYTIKDIVESQVTTPLVMIYNHSLYGYLQSSFRELGLADNITLTTKDKFFWGLAREHNVGIPQGTNYTSKYNALLTGLLDVPLAKSWDIAIIDEVQDLLDKEWQIIKRLAGRITSMGDFNQRLYDTDIQKEAITSMSKVETLFDIFRFHKNIAKIAENFSKKGDGLERKVKKIEQKGVKLIDVDSRAEENTEIVNIINAVKNQNSRIGIVSPNKERLRNLQNYLQANGIPANYYSDNKDLRSHDFSSNDPLLITSYSAKGLEFENVIVIGFENSMVGGIGGSLDEIIYVSLTRSNSGLYIVRTPDTIQQIKNLKVEQDVVSSSDDPFDDIFG